MVRLLVFLALLCLAGLGLAWFADQPGLVTLNLPRYHVETSLFYATLAVVVLAIVIAFLWGIIRFVFRIPSLVSLAKRARRREKGFAALSRGMVAVGSGDARAASRHAAEAHRLIGAEPLTRLLRAQAAQLAGDRAGAELAFKDMLDGSHTHALGLRGLHVEARRRGDHEAALDYAAQAHKHAALPWAGQAVLDDRAARGDWAGALAAVETNAAAKLIDKPAANRLRAVLKTAIAQERAEREPQAALALAQEATRLAPGLVPAAALNGRLTAAAGDYRRAARILETAYEKTPHPDLAAAYLRMRPGDSAADRLTRARGLARLAPNDPESRLTIARAALEARDFDSARAAVAPLLDPEAASGRPSVRACLLMADLEETQGAPGAVREWLARAARAPRDRAWIADGFVSDLWAPVSPAGKLDAFVWRTPEERLSAPDAPLPVAAAPALVGPSREAEDIVEPVPAIATTILAPLVVDAAPIPVSPKVDAPALPDIPPKPPDDPGAPPAAAKRSGFRLFS
ncbi:heme biosynthesis protein HemY [Methylocapsa sp. S129]|uniref:heme biosynthesis protein HemY n=1 Tax=Methylocapsa sp. S129 TaxID=1641869 RepID=UPI00131C64BC|nr:heme biosynthesis HemY N-terminal domain-containing protein [Methylocapsa sp. S129]